MTNEKRQSFYSCSVIEFKLSAKKIISKMKSVKSPDEIKKNTNNKQILYSSLSVCVDEMVV